MKPYLAAQCLKRIHAMKVQQLIQVLQTYNPDHDIVVSGHSGLGLGCDFTVALVHQYDETNYVVLVPGREYEGEQ
jgi:hypothetical protein